MNDIWPTRRLRDIADIRVSNVDKKSHTAETPVRLCNYMDVYANDYITNETDFMQASASPAEIERFSLQRGDVIITKDSETPDDIGVPAVVSDEIENLVCGYHWCLIRPNNGDLNSVYLAKQLTTSKFAGYFAIHASGSTRFGLPIGAIENIDLPFPPKPEQTKIAEILSTVDQAIEQTEALIAKQQRIKTGLMQDLLTRGIDENGNLRSEETHEFKDSPLGRIPVEWDLSELAYAFAEVPRNGIYKPPNQIGSGTLLIGQTSFTKERRIDYRFARRTIVSPSELKAYQLRNHDILVTRVFATVDGVGLPILVTDLPEAAVYESNMLRLRVDSAKFNPTLLFHWLRSSAIRKRVTASVNASNQTSINQTVLNALPALVIPSDEQDNIVAAISAQETYLNDLARNLEKLRSLKTALMQDLLTGKVSVAPLLTEEERGE